MEKKKIFLTLLLFSFLLNSNVYANINKGFLIKNDADKAIIPFHYVNNFIVIPVKFNHGKTLNIILDTGIRSIVLFNKRTSYKNGLFEDREVVFAGAGLKNEVKGFVTNQVIVSLPQVQAKGISVVSLENSFSNLTRLGIDGAMGYQIFSRFVVEIDYRNKCVILHNDKRFTLEDDFATIPIQVEDTRPYVTAEFWSNEHQSKTFKFMIDTGFNNDLILIKNKNTLKVIRSLQKERDNQILGDGLAGSIKGKLAYNFNFNLQTVKLKSKQIFLPNKHVYQIEDQRDGTIGNKLLSKHLVIIDYINGFIYLKPHYQRKSLNKLLTAINKNNWFED